VSESSHKDGLDNEASDRIAAIVRGTVSAAPFVGGLLAELVTAKIPNQRQERLTAYVRALAMRLSALEEDYLSKAISDPENIELIEKGADASVRATSSERIKHITELVAGGISTDKVETIRNARLLDILNQIDDEEVIMLLNEAKFYLIDYYSVPKIAPPKFTSHSEGWEAAAPRILYDGANEHLLRLSLLRKELKINSDNGLPRISSSMRDFEYVIRISSLGILLLRKMGFNDLMKGG
jgi:hypothetical protein